MAGLYPHIKHAHWLFIMLSIILFNIKFWWVYRHPTQSTLPIALRFLPPSNDTMLLFTGMMMMTIAKWPLFGAGAWLGLKLLFVVIYIVLGILCLRSQPRTKKFYIFYVLAMITVSSVAWMAHCKLSFSCHFFANWG